MPPNAGAVIGKSLISNLLIEVSFSFLRFAFLIGLNVSVNKFGREIKEEDWRKKVNLRAGKCGESDSSTKEEGGGVS